MLEFSKTNFVCLSEHSTNVARNIRSQNPRVMRHTYEKGNHQCMQIYLWRKRTMT